MASVAQPRRGKAAPALSKVIAFGVIAALVSPSCKFVSFTSGPSQRVHPPTMDRPSAIPREAVSAELTEGLDLTGKVALVTGASRGIGAQCAEILAKAGAKVIGTATSPKGADAISERFAKQGVEGEGMKLDVTDPKEIEAVMQAIESKYGSTPDVLVNNAGITKDGLMMRMKDKQWGDVIDTNLNSIYRVTKAALKGMTKKKWGRIVSISSVVGSMGNAGQANYAAAKAGLDGFTRAVAAEVGSRGITVNSVAPGFIATDMTEGLKDEWKAKLLERVPAGRLGLPAEIASAVLYLSSPNAAYVTGHTLHVNGGMHMR